MSNATPTTERPKSKSSKPASEADLALKIEAALLTTDRPLPPAKLAELLAVSGVKPVHDAVTSLNQVYEESGRSFRIEQVAGGYQIYTLAEYADLVSSLHKTRAAQKLSPAALETLAIISYKQPILRADVEVIRGVACGEVIRSLMDRRLVKIVGRAEELGRPMLYGTTKQFLEVFGLSSLKDLPKAEELKPKG
jgi:segregation and condensation protein B